ncbi:MAG: L,D-transpeptidase family protein [Chitinophagaceae bacterium]|jgi:L,D-transpeptidase YcbB|nr:L,D-transpeptidase family protein [Chitinophagaceae bacterium]
MICKIFSAVFILSGFLSISLSSCRSSNGKEKEILIDTAPKPANDITLPGNFSTQTKLKFDSSAISNFFQQYPLLKEFDKDLHGFYKNRKFAYAWFDQKGLIEQAGNLFNRIENISDEGVTVQLLYEDEFHKMMDDDSTEILTDKANPTVELMLTAQYFFYAKKIWTGLGIKGMKESNWDLPRKKLAYDAFLDSLLEEPSSVFMKNEPVFRQYGLLKTFLKKYRSIEESGQWKPIQPDQKTYRLNDSSNVVTEIREHLFLLGDLASNNQSHLFDAELELAVKRFQQRYGINDDGIVGPGMIAELNYPLPKRVEQVIVNMERCRWLPVALNDDYIVVNIPEYKFHAFENDSLAWSMNVVVGTVLNKTAIFNGMMDNVVFSPYWNIPASIKNKEILPAIRRNSNYLANNHMEWNGNMIRQKPGPWNALGKVKFLFPNSHSIYLHDTPSKSLFSRDKRAFSHGCIRVEDPKRLAIYVLRRQPEWTEARIDSAMNAEKELYVKIARPIPVFIAYFTSWVDREGRLNFRNDIYKRDERLAEMMIENSKLK